jgi:hypothetical protein
MLGGLHVPFRKYVDAFPPDLIAVMTAALNAAVKACPGPLSEEQTRLMAQRIVDCASNGVDDVAALTRAALHLRQ